MRLFGWDLSKKKNYPHKGLPTKQRKTRRGPLRGKKGRKR